jgi:glycosyltransferase involved in cell wall biosynthesis
VGCRNVVENHVTGLLVRVGDSLDLADKMEKMISFSSCARELMGRRGREKIAREFDEQLVIDAYVEAILASEFCNKTNIHRG